MAPPRIAIFVVAYNAVSTLAKTLDRIPAHVWDRIEEVYVFDDSSPDDTYLVGVGYKAARGVEKLNIYRNPTNRGYGGNQKLGYDYAIQKGYDIVVLLHGDGQYAPEVLDKLLGPLERGEADAVFGSRMLIPGGARHGGMPLYKFVGNKILTTFENRMLGMRLSECHSGYRAYRWAALKEIPYQLCSDDFHFDTEIIIQLHAKGFRIAERPIPTFYGNEICYVNGMQYAYHVVKSTLEYCLHQSGLRYVEKFDVAPPRYPFKTGRWSSHQQLLRLVPPGQRVLDVGCGGGEMAASLEERGCEVVGVDQHIGPIALAACIQTYTCDLERGLDLKEAQLFQTILFADVLEHVKAHERLLQDCHRWLAPGGRLIISTGNVAHVVIRLGLLFGRFDYTPRGILDRTHVVLFTLKSLKRLLAAHQFRIVDIRVTPIPFEAVWPRASHQWWMLMLSAISYLSARLWKTLFAYQFIVVAESCRVSRVVQDALERSLDSAHTVAVSDGSGG